jgi:ATP-dependent RNA helicase RhlE
LSQNKRQSAMNGFRDGSLQILVATDIAARGIDVASISHVINYDIPSTVEAYIHRIGRTGRAAKEGEAFTLITPDNMSEVRAIEKVLGRKIEQRQLENFDYTAAAPARTLESAATYKPARHSRHKPQRSKTSRD